MSVVQEEIFGPVLCAMPVRRRGPRPHRAAGERHELRARRQHLDPRHRHRAQARAQGSRPAHAVNGGAREQSMPFGGFKQSGWGRENGRDGVEAYTELKIVSIGL